MTARPPAGAATVGVIVSLLCVLYLSLFREIPVNGDVLLGLPLGKELATPGLYSPNDLLISSGMRGPFHLYKYFGGWLYSVGAPVDLIWHACFVVFLFLTFLAIWYLSIELTKDLLSSSLVLAALTVAHILRGSLHASAVPISAFVTASAAMPVALYALILLLRDRHFAAMAVSSAVFNIHPYVGILMASATGAVILLTNTEIPVRRRVGIIVAGSTLALPNLVFILTQLPANFTETATTFYDQFRQYALHTFVEMHWREGYGWFFVNLAGALCCSRYIDSRKRRTVWVLFGFWFVLMALYTVNTYVVKQPAILLMYLFRATYFIKPILFILVVHGLRVWREELRQQLPAARAWWMPAPFSAGIVVLFVSAVLPMRFAVLADALALLSYGLFAQLIGPQKRAPQLILDSLLPAGILLTISASIAGLPELGKFGTQIETVITAVVVILAFLSIAVFSTLNREEASKPITTAKQESGFRPVWWALCLLLIHHLAISMYDRKYPLVPEFESRLKRIQMHVPPARTDALMQWVRTATPRGTLFIIPPDAQEDFGAFRLIAERGVYITIMEVNQLAFDVSVYEQANNRLLRLGTRFPARLQFDTRGYHALTTEKLRDLAGSEHVDYAVFEKSRLDRPYPVDSVAYEDDWYLVVDLHAL